jgi:O-antigen/teichoic acid export membrane protein
LSKTTRKLASGSALRFLNFAAQLVAALFLMPFMVGSLGDRMYGFWVLIGKIIDYYGLIDLGITAAVSRHIAAAIGARDDKQCNQVISNALALYSGVAALVGAATMLLVVLAPLFVSGNENIVLFQKVILLLGLNTAVEFPIRVFGGVLTAQLRYDIMSLLKLGTLVLRVSGIVAVLSLGHGLLALALVTVAAGVPEKIAYIYFARRSYPKLHVSFSYLSKKTVRTLYGYGLYVFLIQLGDMFKFNVDSFIIASFVGLAAVTHYGVATSLMINFMSLIGTVMGVLVPVFSRMEAENDPVRIKKAFYLSTKIAICLTSFVSFGFIAWGRLFIERWMGPNYLDAYPCLVILVIGLTVSLWQSASQSLLFGTSKHKFYAIANGAEAAANLALSLLLVRWFGITGVAMGVMAPMLLISLIAQPIYVCRLTGMPYKEYLNEMARTLGVVLVSLIIPGAVSMMFAAADYTRLAVVGLASGLAYLIGIWLYAFKSEESRLIREAVIPQRFVWNPDKICK